MVAAYCLVVAFAISTVIVLPQIGSWSETLAIVIPVFVGCLAFSAVLLAVLLSRRGPPGRRSKPRWSDSDA